MKYRWALLQTLKTQTHTSISNRSSVWFTSADGQISCRLAFSLLACYMLALACGVWQRLHGTFRSISGNRRSLIKLAQSLHSCSQFGPNAHVTAEWERWNANVLLNPKRSHQSLQDRSDWTFVLEQGTFTGTFLMERSKGRKSGNKDRREQFKQKLKGTA